MNLMQERNTIIRGLLFYWDCNICRTLGWDKENGCSDIKKNECGKFVYNKLGKHFVGMSQFAKDRKQ